MTATRRWLTVICSVALFFSSALWANTPVSPVFYQVNFQGKTAWLLGSFHVGKAEFYPLPSNISDAYASAGALVLEVDVRDPAAIGLMRKYGMTPATPDAKTKAAVDNYCADKPYCDQFTKLSPWLQALQFTMLRLSQNGYSADYGTETQLIKQLGQRPLLALETAESQVEMLSSINIKTQWAMVRDAVSAPDSDLAQLVDAWKTGNAKKLSQLSEAELQRQGGTELVKTVLWDRNRVMASGVLNYLNAADKPLFVAVGAGHLVGEHSVVQLLQKAGAKVRDCNQQQCSPKG
ncbi:hypothetical protein HR45_14475 [Shewanella mangrovi]|uniref:Polysaccharide biosynthesis protein GumN n=1 Tax=Shewanella mangrovi TaxID=1515746 RepID=A0A094LNW8_9GAMM|nr:TraB/GumN family protein [Shewanella mangrovi]KFZ36818.1 hypothetical protein HR45_14475 [Shewanella mangrovi]